MATREGNSYFLGKSIESHSIRMDSRFDQLAFALADKHA